MIHSSKYLNIQILIVMLVDMPILFHVWIFFPFYVWVFLNFSLISCKLFDCIFFLCKKKQIIFQKYTGNTKALFQIFDHTQHIDDGHLSTIHKYISCIFFFILPSNRITKCTSQANWFWHNRSGEWQLNNKPLIHTYMQQKNKSNKTTKHCA